MIKYVMVNSDEVVRITNISGTAYTDDHGEKHNEEKVQYIWENGVPKENPKYMSIHYLEEGG